jgi:hypothetical protein
MFKPVWRLVELQSMHATGKEGVLTIAELSKIAPGFFPLDVAPRVYWITNPSMSWIVRGGHMHPEGGKRELIVALAGRIDFEMHMPGFCGEESCADSKRGMLIPNGVWHRMRLSPGAILLSIASTLYAPDESVTAKPCNCDSAEPA